MRSLVVTAAALAFALPATAAPTGQYRATFAEAPAKASFVTRNTIWKCTGATCVAPRNGARDAIMCELAAREAGTLQSFAVADAVFDADALAKCNARAR
ncbi:CC_3452 family protein [Sphingomonas baiyangensis]|uniref:Uncharacterized protein n=1 Tax=Sphingomonas baiyangensis TaxID=2572576 RepID=A0A4U1L8F1_9SPHN|nr:hypothetical protein [Sphingomonas baiyangensis]TKD53074.1 hypothetical protein FBR43_01665 [Sphingomonas baiyangensis]